jgi:FkbM family methyltransferase
LADWLNRASAVSPLLRYATPGEWGGESGVLSAIFETLPEQARFAVEFGQRTLMGGTVSRLVHSRGWSALYMDPEAEAATAVSGEQRIALARETVTSGNINELFLRHGVPEDLDCLVVDIDGIDYWVWRALAPEYKPALVVIEFNAHVPLGVEATLADAPRWRYQPGKDYGASFSAQCRLAAQKGYRLIHVHGPWNLYFLRNDLPWPAELDIRQPLDARGFALLTDTESFYEALCGPGKRPTWFERPEPDVSRRPWELLAPAVPVRELEVADMPIQVIADKHDLHWYQQRKTHEERQSLLYRFLGDAGFDAFVDVGASVGYVSIIAALALPQASGVAIEADPRLARLLRHNLRNNLGHGSGRVEVVNAIVGDRDEAATSFSLNPGSTLDNRVTMPTWEQVRVPALRLDTLLPRLGLQGRTFYKIDTQGYELHVLRGLETTLAQRGDWLIKMEFAPDWLRSQGTDPLDVLQHLQQRYEFAECPERIPFGSRGIDTLFAAPLCADQHETFVAHVCSLSARGLGWVDLIVRPRL